MLASLPQVGEGAWTPTYMDNRTFAVLVLTLGALAAWVLTFSASGLSRHVGGVRAPLNGWALTNWVGTDIHHHGPIVRCDPYGSGGVMLVPVRRCDPPEMPCATLRSEYRDLISQARGGF